MTTALPAELQDFRNFVWRVWSCIGLPDPTPIQYDVADFLQSGESRIIINGFRGLAKTYLTVAYVMWRVCREPDLKIMVVSAGKAFADNVNRFAFQLMECVPELAHLKPSAEQRQSTVEFDVAPAKPSKDPTVCSLGVFGQLTGRRADVIIADDVETPNTAGTAGQREKLSGRVAEFEDILKPGGQIVYLGTPQLEDTLYNELTALTGYQRRIWPARYPSVKQAETLGDELAPSLRTALSLNPELAGRPTDPERYTDQDLLEREAREGRSRFALQFQLDTSFSDRDRYPLKLRDLVVMDLDRTIGPEKVVWNSSPENAWADIPVYGMKGDRYFRPMLPDNKMSDYEGGCIFVDPAGRGKDETAWAVVKVLNGIMFLVDMGYSRDGYTDEVLQRIARAARQVPYLVVESNFGDGMFVKLLTPWLRKEESKVTVEEIRHSAQKELRIIDTLEPVMNQHRLVVDAGLLRRDAEHQEAGMADEEALGYRLAYQMSRVTKDRGALKHDDRLEALAGAVAHLSETMARSNEEALEAKLEAEWEQELANWTDHRNIRKPQTGLNKLIPRKRL